MKTIITGILLVFFIPVVLFSQGKFVQKGNDALGVGIAAMPASFGTTLAAELGLSYQGILDAGVGFQRTFTAGYYQPDINAINVGIELHPFKGKEKFPSGISFLGGYTFPFYREIHIQSLNSQIVSIHSSRFTAHPAPIISIGSSIYIAIQTGNTFSVVPEISFTRSFIKESDNQWIINPMLYLHSKRTKTDWAFGGGGTIVEGNFYLVISLEMINIFYQPPQEKKTSNI